MTFTSESEKELEEHEGGWQTKEYAPRMVIDSSVLTPVTVCLTSEGGLCKLVSLETASN